MKVFPQLFRISFVFLYAFRVDLFFRVGDESFCFIFPQTVIFHIFSFVKIITLFSSFRYFLIKPVWLQLTFNSFTPLRSMLI